MKPVSSKLISAEVASEDVFTHYLMQLRGTWSALTSYKCIIWRFKPKTLNTDILNYFKNENRL